MKPAIALIPIISPDQYPSAVARAMDQARAVETLRGFNRIVVKPNVVNSSPPPVTTDARCVMAVVAYLKERLEAAIVVAEGSGEGSTLRNFERNGYGQITGAFGVELVDSDAMPVKRYTNPRAKEFTEIFLPEFLEGAALVSVPAAKDHTITQVTLGLKNMVGFLPASHYSGYWSYKKSRIHALDEDQAVADLMLYLRPHLTVIDAREGLLGGHLGGRIPKPPIGRIVASADVLAADRQAARLLGHRAGSVRHIELAEIFRSG